MNQPPRIFIGSGDVSLLERKTLIYSLKKHSSRDLDIKVFDGTNSVLRDENGAILDRLSPRIRSFNKTEFSLYRFLIPKLCNFEGRALWLDSDIVALDDIEELFALSLNNKAFAAKKDPVNPDFWALSVMLLDCSRARFDLDLYLDQLAEGSLNYNDLMWMSKTFLDKNDWTIQELNSDWNMFDECTETTKMIHYTDLHTQPWRFPNHSFENIWFKYFKEAFDANFIQLSEVESLYRKKLIRSDFYQKVGIKRPFSFRKLIGM